jgi:tetratricopeptide (TPR) repeat protein
VALSDPDASDTRTLLRELGETLRAAGRTDLCARAAEAELAALERHDADRTRRVEIRRELAALYQRVLGVPDAALHHLHQLLEGHESGESPLDPRQLDQVEEALLDLLRANRNHVEVEQRLTTRLERGAGEDPASAGADSWLELARLRDEKLHRACAAAVAYRKVLEARPSELAAIRGLRQLGERLGNWEEVAKTLEAELRLPECRSERERNLLLRRLGDVCWRRLHAPERAAHAYADALEALPDDLDSLRSLQRLRENDGEVRDAIELFRREIEVLGEQQPERRREVWLHVGELARDREDDPEAALAAFEEAGAVSELEPEHLREWAELYRRTGRSERFAEVFARWCDDARASGAVSCSDHLDLVQVLEELGWTEKALARAHRATELDEGSVAAWDTAARLCEERNETRQASEALERAAGLESAGGSCQRLVHAARLVASDDPERAAGLLRRACQVDPGSARALAHLAGVSATLETWEEAETAAGRTLDLAQADDATDPERALEPELRIQTALAGGRAARERNRLESSARFYAAALALAPENLEALEAHGELLFLLGDPEAARGSLERSLELRATGAGRSSDRSRARHLAMLGAGLEQQGDEEGALARFQKALELCPEEDDAHAGVVRVHQCAGRIDRAVAALKTWAAIATTASQRSDRLLRAAELELQEGSGENGEVHLREAVEADPAHTSSWLRLANLLWDAERRDETLEAATRALEQVEEREARAQLWLLRGRVLDSRGEQEEAARAYGEAATWNPRCSEAALAQSRLLRAQGEWRAAAEGLDRFARAYPESRSRDLARIFHERGRLMAGPLEEVEEAVRCYERAVELDPGFSEAREPLSRLLTHIRDRWRDAVRHHRALLAEHPTRRCSIRSLIEIARRRGDEESASFGLALLRALGAASPSEREEAPRELPQRISGTPRLEDETAEKLRSAVREIRRELAEALGVGSEEVEAIRVESPARPLEHFQSALEGAEGELSAPCLRSLSSEDLAQLFRTLAALALDPAELPAGNPVAERLERSVGRWTRRKLRRLLDGVEFEEIAALDADAWRQELGELTAALALDEVGGDLRTALIALAADDEESLEGDLGDEVDLCDRVLACRPTRRLLERIIGVWCGRLGEGAR